MGTQIKIQKNKNKSVLGLELRTPRGHGFRNVRQHLLLATRVLLGVLIDEMILTRPRDNLIVDIRNIDLEKNIVPEILLQDAAHDIERQIRARVANMGHIVNRRAAQIHFHLATLYGNERLLIIGKGVVNLQTQILSVPLARHVPGRVAVLAAATNVNFVTHLD